ncbi:MAG: ribonuclease R [Pseudomonadota bacterium]
MTETKTEILNDPYADREKENYENPVPSREFILDLIESQGKALNRDTIIKLFDLSDPNQLEGIRRRLKAMERDGQLVWIKGYYHLISEFELLEGIVSAHPDGFGFLLAEDGGEDVFLSQREMKLLFHEDRVSVRVTGTDRKGRRHGVVAEVITHNTHTITGLYTSVIGRAMVIPDHKKIQQDIYVDENDKTDVQEGQIVVIEITTYPTYFKKAEGNIIQVLGEHMHPGQEIEVSVRIHDIPHQWPEQVEEIVATLESEVKDEDKKQRQDLTETLFVTIDGEDAKDFDDAVFCVQTENGWRLKVAIADVSFYVKNEQALDIEAKNRGTSVYFPGRVIPMLPEQLSNGLCSLNPQVDRLVMVCDINFSQQGEVLDYEFSEAVIKSAARLTYTKVADMLIDGDAQLCQQYNKLLPSLHELYQLYQVLIQKRRQRGAIDFETVETSIVFGEQKKIDKIVPIFRNDAHRIIEECMLAANVCAADFLIKNKVPTLYRNHQGPTDTKLKSLRDALALLGLSLTGGEEPQALDYAQLLESIKKRPDFDMLQTMMLRSLSQAKYEAENIGHFGLSYPAYAHFTSPIRRYPDLIVHRCIKSVIRSEKAGQTQDAMFQLGEHCSMTERRADEATRDVMDWLKCEYMLDKVGEEFDGIITTVTGFGFFVELEGIHVEGLVHVTSLKSDYYLYDQATQQMKGERTGISYKLGTKIRIRVASVSLDERKIDFILADSFNTHSRNTKAKTPSSKNNTSAVRKSSSKTADKSAIVKTEKKEKKKKTRRSRKTSFSRRL